MQIEQIHGFRIGRQIVVDGMTEVYEAYQEGLDRPVAIKFIKVSLAEDAEFVERFRFDGRICAKLNHPNIVYVYHVDIDSHERPYLVMELLQGQTLRQRLKADPMPEAEVVAIARQVLSALAYAHQRGVVHRDIEPSHIFLCDGGGVKVMDFYIAHTTFEKRLTRMAARIGTPEYMSPEQVTGTMDARSDLYSLGIMMHEMLTGSVPFRAPSTVGVLYKHAYTPVPELPTTISPQLRSVVKRVLAKDPAARFASADEMLLALERPLPTPLAGKIL